MARKSAASFEGPTTNGHATTPLNQDQDDEPSVKPATVPKTSSSEDEDETPATHDLTLLPGGTRDLSFIGLQAFLLGLAFAAGILLTVYFLSISSPWWRLPAFITCLSLFHFLEYYTTAHYNCTEVKASSFLLYNNGKAYVVAHCSATLEVIVSSFFPRYQAALVWSPTIAIGLLLVVVGQVVRSIAMATAGTNFNHIVATEHKKAHVLVTDGIYAWFRHPSYFGFFWWAMGTQFLVGNKVCVVGFALALWGFFDARIRSKLSS